MIHALRMLNDPTRKKKKNLWGPRLSSSKGRLSRGLFVPDQAGGHGLVLGVHGRDDGAERAETGRDRWPVGRQFGNVPKAVAHVPRQQRSDRRSVQVKGGERVGRTESRGGFRRGAKAFRHFGLLRFDSDMSAKIKSNITVLRQTVFQSIVSKTSSTSISKVFRKYVKRLIVSFLSDSYI